MSALVRYNDVKFKNAEILLRALRALGFNEVRVTNEPHVMEGWQGRNAKVHISISKEELSRQTPGHYYAGMGFVYNGENLIVVADHYDVDNMCHQRGLNAIKAAYAQEAALEIARRKGAIVSDKLVENADGTIHRQIKVRVTVGGAASSSYEGDGGYGNV